MTHESSSQEMTLTGVGVSSGVAVGPIAIVVPPQPLPDDEPPSADPVADLALLAAVLEAVAEDLDERAGRLDGEAADMVAAAAMIARDPGLVDAIEVKLAEGLGPAHALRGAFDGFADQLLTLGGYLAERVSDLRDVGARAEAFLLGTPIPGVPELTAPSIVVAEDLAPAETALLDPQLVLGLITQAGGRTSHTAILAAQRGLPAVVRASGVMDLRAGTVVAFDGDTGVVTVAPSAATVEALNARAEARTRINDVTGPGATADGHAVALLANIGSVADAEAAGDVEGVGLFRTEFVFLSADRAPTVNEQAQIYTDVLAPFGDRPVTVRTLDAGADKPLAFANLGAEPNPALGRRGLRLMTERPTLLADQLAALAEAQRRTGATVKVMAPMVATAAEAAEFAESAHAAGIEVAGTMIEVPAAALRARDVLAGCDFASLGTNDLAQYTMAADRLLGELSDLLDPFQPAVLDLIAVACDAGREAGKPIGVCGESAGDALMALVLAGLGVTSLSMAPSRVPLVRFALRQHTLEECRQMAVAARAASDAPSARAAVAALVSDSLRALL